VNIPSQLVDALLEPVFGLVLATWAGASLLLLKNGLQSGRRALALEQGRRALARIDVPETDEEGLRTAVVSVFAVLARDVVLPLSVRGTGRPTLDRIVADAAIARMGRGTLEAIATTTAAPKYNWRRIAAMHLLATGAHSGLVPLLRRTLDDLDPEIVGASLAILGRVPDPAAATALVEALKNSKYAPSRIATYLDQFPLEISGLFVPLLRHPDPNVRYWGATLLSRDGGADVAPSLRALTEDSSPLVRKAAVATLARLDKTTALPAARALLADDVWYVRAHAARALGEAGGPDVAEEIAPLLADREWWVRVAAKESLQTMGEEVWAVLVPLLDHADPFARNGAAEVLQNIGILDSLIVLEAATARPSATKLDMLRKIASAGGTRMTEALLERVDADTRPRVRTLLQTLGLAPTEAPL
jgi:HEAT repeat protein